MKDQPEFDYDVFISYSSQNKEWVHDVLLEKIENAGLRAFIDFRDFRPGAFSIREMERGVTTSRKILLVLTPEYIESEWCEIESVMGQTRSPANRDLRLIPLLKKKCERPPSIEALTYIDFTEGADLDLSWHKVLSSLEASTVTSTKESVPNEVQSRLDEAKILTDIDKYSEAIPILEEALDFADRSDHALARVKVRINLAHAFYEAHERYSDAEQLFRDALALVPVDNLELKHNVLHGLGDMLLFSGRLDEAKAVIHKSKEIANRKDKSDDLAGSLISLSLLDRALGFYDVGIDKLDKAIHLLLQRALTLSEDEKKSNAHILAVCYINKALLCRDLDDLEQAQALQDKAVAQCKISGDLLNKGRSYLFCGEIHCTNAEWEEGFDSFKQALDSFSKAKNPLWVARALEHISRLFATHQRWEEALQAMLSAAAGAEESEHRGEQVHFLCLTAKLLREWKTEMARNDIRQQIHNVTKEIPDEKQAELIATISDKINDIYNSIETTIRNDEEICDMLTRAKKIARKEQLNVHHANCLLDEAEEMVPPENIKEKEKLIGQAIDLLREELRGVEFPKKRGHLMGRISALYLELGQQERALSWLKKAGKIFSNSGDAYGLANYHGSLAEIYRKEGRLNDEIAAYREVLSIVEGRSFYRLATGARINLAAALRFRREFSEAQKLLEEAETLCKKHHFDDFITAIARNRNYIENELQASQAPTETLPQLLDSLNQLIKYRPDQAVAYLPFWYFAWQTELMTLLRSGSKLSFVVMTNDVERFLRFSKESKSMADYFLIATSTEPTVNINKGVIPIPPNWRFPTTFTLLLMKDVSPENESGDLELYKDSPPDVRLLGPANMLPLYTLVEAKSDVDGEGHMMALSKPALPQEAIDLMINRSIAELIELRTIWLPISRSNTTDSFLTELRISYERGVFPVYFDRLPTSNSVTVFDSIQLSIPNKVLNSDHEKNTFSRWRRSLLKLSKLSKADIQTVLLELPEIFEDIKGNGVNFTQIDIYICEFKQIDERVCQPVLLIKE